MVEEKDTVLKNSDDKVTDELNYENNLDKAIADDSDRALIKRILELLEDAKAEEIVLIDAQHRSSLADYLLICEGRSQLHCRGIAENVEHNLKREGEASLGIEGEREGNWVLLDYGNIMLHVFHPEIRKYYKLEEWNDVDSSLSSFLNHSGPSVLEVFMDPHQGFLPKVKGVPKTDGSILAPPIEEMSPLVPMSELKKEMITKLSKKSKQIKR